MTELSMFGPQWIMLRCQLTLIQELASRAVTGWGVPHGGSNRGAYVACHPTGESEEPSSVTQHF